MPTEIDSLQIRIESEAKNAGDGVDKLAKSLGRLKSALANSGGAFGNLVTLANNAQTAGEKVGDTPEKLTRLAAALEKLGKVGKVTVNPALGSSIGDIVVGTRDMKAGFEQKMTALANGLDAISKVGNVKISSTIASEISNIGRALETMTPGNMAKAPQVAQAIGAFVSVSGIKIPDKLADTLMNIGAASELLQGADFTPLTTLAAALTPLSQLGTIHINRTLADSLFNIAAAAQLLGEADLGSLSSLAAALEPLSRIGNIHLGSVFNQLERIPKVFEALKGVDMGSFADMVRQLSDALAPLATNLTSVQTGLKGLAPSLSAVARGMDKVNSSSKKAGSGVGHFGIGLIGAYAVARRLGSVIGKWVNESNRYIENLNLFTASMGEYASKAQEYAEHVGELMGIDPSDWMRNQGVFMTLATGFGIAGDRANYMSQQLTQLGYDLSSFFNIAVEGEGGAMQKLQAGLAGELEPLRRLGFDLSQAKLQMIAYDLGIQKTYNDMTQAEKAQLRYYAILTQVSTAHGDMARTINSPANQIRILQAQVQQCARAFGNIFIPALNAVLPVCIAVAKALRIVAAAIAQLFGFVLPDVDYSNITSGMTDIQNGANGAGKAVKKLKSYLMGFDELNVIEPPQDDAGGGGGGGGGNNGLQSNWDWDLPGYDFLAGLVDNTVDVWMAKFQPAIDWTTSHLELIGGLIATAGAALLAWKFADTFLPNLQGAHDLLAGISGMVLGAITATITVGLSYVLANDYDQTGDYSSLIGSGLVSALGAAIAGGVVAKATGKGAYGLTTTGVTLAISGLANLSLTLGNISKNGINKNNLISLAWEGIKTAVGVGMIAHSIPALKECALEAGGLTLGLIATAGLILGAKQAIEEDEHFTPRVIALVGGAAMAFSTTLNSVAKQFKWEKVNGVWTFFAAASAGLAITAGAAVLKSGKATWDVLVAQAVSSVAAAIAASNLAQQYGLEDKKALLMGVGAFSISLGANLMIDSFAEIKKEGLSADAVMKDLVATALFAAGTAAVAKAIGFSVAGVAGGAVIGLASGLALTAILTVFALSANINGGDASLLPDFGTINATKEQLQSYFNTLFKFPVMATAQVASTLVLEADNSAKDLNDKIITFQGQLNKIVVGAKIDENAEANMLAALQGEGGIINSISQTLSAQNEVVTLGVSLSPSGDDTGSAAILNAFSLSSTAINTAASEIGTTLAGLITKSVNDKLTAEEQNMITNMTVWLSRINAALQQGQTSGEFLGTIQLTLGDLDEDSFKRAVEVYKEYKDTVTASLNEIAVQTSAVLQGQKDALLATIEYYESVNQEVPAEVTEALTAINAAIEEYNPVNYVRDNIGKTVDPAKQEMINAFNQIFNGSREALGPILEHYQLYNGDILTTLIKNQDTANATTELNNMITQVLSAAFGDNYEFAMDVAGMLDMTGWDVLGADIQKQLYLSISSAVGDSEAKKLFRSAGLDLGNLIAAGVIEPDYSAGILQKTQDGFNKKKPKMAVAVGLDDPEYNTVTDIIKNRKMGKGTPEVPIKPVIPGKPATVSGYTKENLMGTTDVEQKVKVGLAGKHPTVSENIAKTKMGKVEVLQNVKVGLSGKYPTVSENIARTKMGKTSVDQGVGLTKKGWTNVATYVDDYNTGTVTQKIALGKGWTVNSLADYVTGNTSTGAIEVPVNLKKGNESRLEWTFKQGGTQFAPKYMLYGSGGFPTTGQAFVAREAGPELVGTIGRRSAVVNNDQIVESVSGGVREANTDVVNAIYTLIAAVEAKDMNVSFPDDAVGRAADRYHMKRGATVNTGAFANAY